MKKILIIIALTALSSTAFAITPKLSEIKAQAYILVAYPHFKIISEQNSHQKIIPASLTKILTAYIIFDQIKKGLISLNDQVQISENAMQKTGSKSFLEASQKFSIHILLKGLIIQSGNDAATALAEYIAGSEKLFSSLMNGYAKEIGMKNSHFVNASGLPDPQHYSTAYDLALLSLKLILHFPELYTYYSKKSFEINGIKQFNRNKLLSKNQYIDGIKTGYTKEGKYNLAASINEKNNRFISVVIGSKTVKIREFESLKILNFANRFFETTKITNANEVIAKIPLYYSDKKQIPVGTEKPIYITVSKLDKGKVQSSIKVNKKLFAPLAKGEKIGEITVKMNEKILIQKPIITLEAAKKSGVLQQFIDTIRSWF